MYFLNTKYKWGFFCELVGEPVVSELVVSELVEPVEPVEPTVTSAGSVTEGSVTEGSVTIAKAVILYR